MKKLTFLQFRTSHVADKKCSLANPSEFYLIFIDPIILLLSYSDAGDIRGGRGPLLPSQPPCMPVLGKFNASRKTFMSNSYPIFMYIFNKFIDRPTNA